MYEILKNKTKKMKTHLIADKKIIISSVNKQKSQNEIIVSLITVKQIKVQVRFDLIFTQW